MCHLKLKLLSFNRNDNQGAKLRKRFFFIQYLLKEIYFLTLFALQIKGIRSDILAYISSQLFIKIT